MVQQKMADSIEAYRFWFEESGFFAEPKSELSVSIGKNLMEEDRYRFLYQYAFKKCPKETDAAGRYLVQIASVFSDLLFHQPDIEILRENLVIEPDEGQLNLLLSSVPFAIGSEYVNEEWLKDIFKKLNQVYADDIRSYSGTVAFYLAEKSQKMSVPERVFFHLVENDETQEYPFAFLATYGTKLASGKVKHVPLKYALTEYAQSNEQLLTLLSCLNRVSEVSPLIGEYVERGELFHPLRLTAEEAYQILKVVPEIEKTGVICRVPNWWKRNTSNIEMAVKLGEEKPTYLGLNTLLTMRPSLMVDGIPLTQDEIQHLLGESEGLFFLKGKWVTVNHERLQQLLELMDSYEGDVSLLQALRSGIEVPQIKDKESIDVGPLVTNGEWLQKLLSDIRNPGNLKKTKLPKTLKAVLRPYQKEGYEWLRYMEKLKFGACLADDMGLGKTVQVLAFLENMRTKNKRAKVLLVVPASLIGNWTKEADRFVPSMSVGVLHGRGAKAMDEELKNRDGIPFLSITTYGMTARMKELSNIQWDCLILDEAQAIKNPGTEQTRRIKRIPANMKIAMTGTPIENDLSNLWSLFDFLDKGLLGSSAEFKRYTKRLNEHPEGYAKLKSMITPFMLRRVKTDKKIIADLPDKVENVDYVTLSRKQKVLYRKYVKELEVRINEVDGLDRRGVILGAIVRLKQICNHPDQYLGQETYDVPESGKFEMLREICETIREKHERVLVFTQFKEITEYLDHFLAEIFGRKGFVLHGGTPVKSRGKMVEAFQGEKYVPYMVLSVKAGGTGLNLTKANHVIHFDRWWNPAVENQATDRAFRIGQTKKVMVHKLVCRGTIEEKIDAMIRDKVELANNIIGSGGEAWITELSNEELMSVMRLDF